MDDKGAVMEMVRDIVAAYVSHNNVEPSNLPALIRSVHAALSSAGQPPSPPDEPVQALTTGQIRKSITPDGLISFVDGKSYKTLKRHLSARGVTFDEYKAKFGLPHDYPSTAPSYSEKRAAMARFLGLGTKGLGRKGGGETAEKTPAKRGRPPGSKKSPAPRT